VPRTAHDRLTATTVAICPHPLLGRFTDPLTGSVVPGDQEGRPDPLVMSAVIDIVDRHGRVEGAELLGINMFVPDSSARTALSELDLAIVKHLDSLADVCLRPRDRLGHLAELTRVELARRVPPAGLTRLASHSEDSAGFEHGKLRPLRVLSTRYTDDVDFYENRVAAQLVDRLDQYLGRRMAGLRVLALGLADVDEYNRALSRRQSWRKLERTATLVATVLEDHRASSAAIRQSLDQLSRLRTRLRLLWGSPALRGANRRVRLPLRLMRTNLFVQEPRYRRVGELWEAWALHEADVIAQQQLTSSRFAPAYDAYVAIMTVRALNVLGYTVERTTGFPERGGTARLRRSDESATCSVNDTGVVEIRVNGLAATRVVPLAHDLSAGVSARTRALWLAQLPHGETVVVYPGLRSERIELTADVRLQLHSAIRGVVPVSPIEIEAEERLARALRWPMQAHRLLSGYPVPVAVRSRLPVAEWFRQDRGRVLATRRPTPLEVAALTPATGGRRAPAGSEASVAGVVSEIDRGMAFLQTCLLCAAPSAELTLRNLDTFRCVCRECTTAWGLNLCGNCGERYPVLLPHNAVVDASDSDRLDATVGADLLAEPCRSPEVAPGARFRCPWCRHCRGMPACGCPTG
jgi:hypothetical protein